MFKRKKSLRFLSMFLSAALIVSYIPASASAEEGMGEDTQDELQVAADWKFGQQFTTGKLDDGSLTISDQSGNGNDLKMEFYDGGSLTDEIPQDTGLSFSDDDMDSSGDGSMVFSGDSVSKTGADFITKNGAGINQEKFSGGYTLEFLYYFPQDWTTADSWMGLMARQVKNKENVTSMDEAEMGSMSVAVSSCKEIQFVTAPADDNHTMSSAAWSVSMDKGGVWYHIAITSDGNVIRTFVNGCEAFRDYASEDMDGLFADPEDGRFRIGSSHWDDSAVALDKFLQGSLQEVRISEGALEQEDWLVQNPEQYLGEYGNNDTYALKNDENYNFVLLPDTQNTVKYKDAVMDTAIDELIDTADELNVKGVIHLGDLVENNNDATQYENARKIFYQLPDAGIRTLVEPGNHDGLTGEGANYANSFGEDSLLWKERTSWYLTPNGCSSYMLVDAGSYTYLVISLACTGSAQGSNSNTSWDSSQEEWFKGVLAQYPGCPTIVTTHDLQHCSDTTPNAITLSPQGQKLWNIVKSYDQVFMLVGGHSHGSGVAELTNDNGKQVISILSDYQFAYNGGNGLFRYLEFDEKDNKLYYSAYSPYAASLSEDEKTFFDVNFLTGAGNEGSVDLNFADRFSGMAKESGTTSQGKWMSGEYHTHTGQSKDATESFMSLENVLGAAFRDKQILDGNEGTATKTDNIVNGTGFDFLSISDHFRRSYNGVDEVSGRSYDTPFYIAVQTQQREIEKLKAQGKYNDKLIYSTTEWDMPGLDHAVVGLIAPDSDEVPYQGIHEFEWDYASAKDGDDRTSMFTNTGNAFSGDFDEQQEWGDRQNANGATADVAYDGVNWVKENYPDSFVLPNHPSRHNGGGGAVTIENLRKLNDIAPSIVFGMEGMPGNQMDPACELHAEDIRAGADEMISVTGGVWDAMLSEGRRFYNFANSDFHFKISSNQSYSSGYWASEFSKNCTWVEPGEDQKFNFKDVVAGLRSGNSYSVKGDLISDLTFTVSNDKQTATMGQELNTYKNDEVTVTMKFKVPEQNNYQSLYNTNTGITVDNTPEVDHIDLIMGHVTGKVSEDQYGSTDNTDARIVQTFTKPELAAAKEADGYYTLTYNTPADGDLYFRLRGLSCSEVDENGDPLTHERTVSDVKPERFDQINDYNYSHLSFYANPIFVNADELTGIEITTQPSKTVYRSGDQFDPAGMEVTAHFADGTSRTVTDYTFTPNGQLTTADNTVTVTYRGLNAMVAIEVTSSHSDHDDEDDSRHSHSESSDDTGAVVSGTSHGTVSITPNNPKEGDQVVITVLPNAGYKADGMTVIGQDGEEITVTLNKDGTYTFIQPAGKVSIKSILIKDKPQTERKMSFSDVSEDSWYHDAVEKAFQNGWVSGISETTFSPYSDTTRGMIVTILYRMEGKAEPFKELFSDVASGKYYTAAVSWAAENGIVSGYGNGMFGPDDAISREQVAVILYRHAVMKGYDSTKTASLDQFTDSTCVSDYAKEAMSWAVANGIFNGKGDGILDPAGRASRSQIAALLVRFTETFEK